MAKDELIISAKERLKILKEIEQIEKKLFDGVNIQAKTRKKYNDLLDKSYSVSSASLDIDKQISKLQNTSLGKLNKQLGLDKQISALEKVKEKGSLKQIKNASKLSELMADVASGNKDFSKALKEIADEDFGDLNDAAKDFGRTLQAGGKDLEKNVKRSAKFGSAFDDIKEKVSDMSEILRSPQAMGAAVIAFIVKEMVDFAQKALEVRQSLGISVIESARLAGNMKLAAASAKAVGGNTEQAVAAVTSLGNEFGSIDVISAGVSAKLGLITGQFGLSGDNAGKLLKTMQGINGASIETNLNTLETVGNLARAARVAPAAVLNDMAENSETFAKFAMQGGDNLAKAAITARKLGLNLSTVDKIAESIMDIEGSIEREMEASMLIGKQMSLDRARQLVMEGDMAGVLEEVKRQAGGAAEFAKLDFIQRKSLAAAVGLEVSELAKLAAGEEQVAKLEEERSNNLAKNMALGAAAGAGILAIAMALKAVFTGGFSLVKDTIAAGKGAASGLAIGAGIGAGAGAIASAAGMEKGGVVKKGGMAVVHKGEAFSGTRNEMGMGNGQTNILLKQLIKQNEVLMNRLTNRIGDIALSSAT
tara:strand:+ start:352 stop:2127 length:1776 start_codon:yes stop_codon:yes gene_type:complete